MYGEIDGLTKVPETTTFAWGARAIKEEKGFTLLEDRMTFRFFKNGVATHNMPPNQHKAYMAFEHWFSGRAIKAARKWAGTERADSTELFKLDNGTYHYRATCNASYGYVYMTAWAD